MGENPDTEVGIEIPLPLSLPAWKVSINFGCYSVYFERYPGLLLQSKVEFQHDNEK